MCSNISPKACDHLTRLELSLYPSLSLFSFPSHSRPQTPSSTEKLAIVLGLGLLRILQLVAFAICDEDSSPLWCMSYISLCFEGARLGAILVLPHN